MKKLIVFLMLLFCSPSFAIDLQIDLDQIIHVDGASGNDADTGVGFAEARATIIEAITDSADGDVILIWPGVYDEAVDITTTQVHLMGTNRYWCKIVRTGVGEVGVLLGDNTRLSNLWIECTAENDGGTESYAVDGSDNGAADNVVIEDCIIKGTYLGLYLTNQDNVTIRDCYIYGTRRALSINGTESALIEDCHIETVSVYSSTPNTYGAASLNGNVIVKKCTFRVTSTTEHNDDVIALENNAVAVSEISISDSTFTTIISGLHTGNSYAYHCIHATGNKIMRATFNNCTFRASGVAGTVDASAVKATKNNVVVINNSLLYGEDYDAETADAAKIYINGGFADRSKFSGGGVYKVGSSSDVESSMDKH